VTAAPVTLTLRLPDQRRQFRPGEVIPIELEFSSATTKRFTVDGATYDRSGRLTIDEFVIDRIEDVSDPMLDYFGSIGGYIGGGLRGIGVLGEKAFTVKLELNEWFRFDKPGIYTLAVKSRRVTDESVSPHAVISVESDTVSFEISTVRPLISSLLPFKRWDNTDRQRRSSRSTPRSSDGTRRGPAAKRSWSSATPSNARARDRRGSRTRFDRRSEPVRAG
jgi:hypothetical protein